jgi:hypothetical protein
MTEEPPSDEIITFKGTDIRELSREHLIEAVREGFAELVTLRNRLSDEGRMEAAREEDFARQVRARSDYFGTVADFQSRLFDSATAYNQLIVIGGYAAFFGLWSGVAKEINRTALLSSGLLILVSLLIYVTWTVIGMYRLQGQNIATLQTFEQGVEGFEERFKAAVAAAHGTNAKLLRLWRPVVWAAGLSAFAAAALLGGAAFLSLIRSNSVPQASKDNTEASAQRATAAAAKAECYAHVAELYGRVKPGVGQTATNLRTGQHALLVAGRWEIVPTC